MKRTIAICWLLALLALWGCRTVIHNSPSIEGCSCSVTALGTHLVAGMDWTNPVTGRGGVGSQSLQIEDGDAPGAKVNVYADPSIACATNLPNIALITWKCKTNNPVSQFWQLPSACNGFQHTVTFNCSNCSFSVSQAIGFDCYIYRPNK